MTLSPKPTADLAAALSSRATLKSLGLTGGSATEAMARSKLGMILGVIDHSRGSFSVPKQVQKVNSIVRSVKPTFNLPGEDEAVSWSIPCWMVPTTYRVERRDASREELLADDWVVLAANHAATNYVDDATGLESIVEYRVTPVTHPGKGTAAIYRVGQPHIANKIESLLSGQTHQYKVTNAENAQGDLTWQVSMGIIGLTTGLLTGADVTANVEITSELLDDGNVIDSDVLVLQPQVAAHITNKIGFLRSGQTHTLRVNEGVTGTITWAATAGTVASPGTEALLTAPTVTLNTDVTVTMYQDGVERDSFKYVAVYANAPFITNKIGSAGLSEDATHKYVVGNRSGTLTWQTTAGGGRVHGFADGGNTYYPGDIDEPLLVTNTLHQHGTPVDSDTFPLSVHGVASIANKITDLEAGESWQYVVKNPSGTITWRVLSGPVTISATGLVRANDGASDIVDAEIAMLQDGTQRDTDALFVRPEGTRPTAPPIISRFGHGGLFGATWSAEDPKGNAYTSFIWEWWSSDDGAFIYRQGQTTNPYTNAMALLVRPNRTYSLRVTGYDSAGRGTRPSVVAESTSGSQGEHPRIANHIRSIVEGGHHVFTAQRPTTMASVTITGSPYRWFSNGLDLRGNGRYDAPDSVMDSFNVRYELQYFFGPQQGGWGTVDLSAFSVEPDYAATRITNKIRVLPENRRHEYMTDRTGADLSFEGSNASFSEREIIPNPGPSVAAGLLLYNNAVIDVDWFASLDRDGRGGPTMANKPPLLDFPGLSASYDYAISEDWQFGVNNPSAATTWQIAGGSGLSIDANGVVDLAGRTGGFITITLLDAGSQVERFQYRNIRIERDRFGRQRYAYIETDIRWMFSGATTRISRTASVGTQGGNYVWAQSLLPGGGRAGAFGTPNSLATAYTAPTVTEPTVVTLALVRRADRLGGARIVHCRTFVVLPTRTRS